jgi:hypothetical protein
MLGRLDILVFADGIGENAPRGCAQICYGLGFLGIELEKAKLGQRSRGFRTANVKQLFRDKLLDYKAYIKKTKPGHVKNPQKADESRPNTERGIDDNGIGYIHIFFMFCLDDNIQFHFRWKH